jgi:hypothetical protein
MAEEELESASAEDLSEEEEDLESSPDDDTVGEIEDEEIEEEPPWKRVRADIYRRQSLQEERTARAEQQVQNAMSELRGLMEGIRAQTQTTRTPETSSPQDPMAARLKLQQDPAGFVREQVQSVLKGTEDRVAEKVVSQTTLQRSQEQLARDFPETQNPSHPFYGIVDKVYSDMVRQGMPDGPGTAIVAARLAAAEHPELREKNMTTDRRRRAEKDTRTRVANGNRMESAPKPKRKESSSLPSITPEDEEIARNFKVDLNDPKEKEWIQKEKAKLGKMRIGSREEE